MSPGKFLPTCATLLLAAGCVAAQAPAGNAEGGWVSYRDAYRSMLWFEKYGKPKQFIQNHYQVVPRDAGVALEGVRLTLSTKTTQLDLPLDALGRTVFPLLKSAYDDNAELTLNRKLGPYRLRARASIVVRPDGVYDVSDLRAACAQLLGFARYVNPAAERGHGCAGVRFTFARKDSSASVKFKKNDAGLALPLPVAEGAAFPDETNGSFRIVNYRFADWPDKGQIVTQSAPLAIAALFE
jgi:hypothetical protein